MSDPDRDSSLVGREREQELLRDALNRARIGNGGVVLIGGEAGIGKTTLASWLEGEATVHGVLVLSGSCYDLQTTPPFGPWRDALWRYQRVHAVDTAVWESNLSQSSLTPGVDRFELIQSDIDALIASGPALLTLEDMHWSDPASLDLLRVISRRARGTSTLILVTYRTGGTTPDHLINTMLPLLVRESGAERVDLRRLLDTGVRRIIDGRYALEHTERERLIHYVEGRAEGNPFLLGEVLRELEAERILYREGEVWNLADIRHMPVPPLVQQIVRRRVADLEASSQQMLGLASVIGYDVPLDLWQASGNVEDTGFERAVEQSFDSQLLIPQPGNRTMRFQHALVRETLYEALTPLRRRQWHAQVADVLLARDSPDPDMLAHHLQASGDPRALEWLVRAGMSAVATNAWHSAADRFREAAQLLGGHLQKERERAWLHFMSGFLLRYSNSAHTLDDLDVAERLAIDAGDEVLLGFVRYHRGASRAMRGDVRRGLIELEGGVDDLDALPYGLPLADTATVTLSAIGAMFLAPGQESRTSVVQDSVPEGQSRYPCPQRGILINWLGMSGHFRRAMEMGELLLAETQEAVGNDHLPIYQYIAGHLGLAHAYGALGRPDDARREYAIALEWFGRTGVHVEIQFTIWSDLQFSMIPYRADDLAGRRRLRSLAARNWARSASISVSGPADAAPAEMLVNVLEGRWDQALRAAVESRSDTYILSARQATAVLAWLSAQRGDVKLAWECIFELLPDGYFADPGDSHFPIAMTAQMTAATLLLDAGENIEAGRWIDANHAWLDWSGATLWVAEHHVLRSRLEEINGNLDGARSNAERAVKCGSSPRRPLALVASLRRLGELNISDGLFDAARKNLVDSRTLAESCGAPYERALSLFALARLYQASGDVERATSTLAEARTISSQLQAAPLIGRIESLRQSLAGDGREAPLDHLLSPRELDVLAHLIHGCSNQEIADILFISPRTVANHVTSIMNKLGVDSRTAAATWAVRQGIG